LPGKQMAIDADLNAGLLTPDEAKAKRQEVATEADFYGSMDGASKFVKGDAVAGVLILVINILGGLILGVVSHGMSMGDAAATYIQLAIGDALVAQVPALLLSIAAAAIVTRVSSPLDLSGQITSQFGSAKASASCRECRTSSSCPPRCSPAAWPGSCAKRRSKARCSMLSRPTSPPPRSPPARSAGTR
jgi:flagellar biosynthesis protein FlhA